MKHLPLKNLLLLIVSIVIFGSLTVACSDDEPEKLHTPYKGSDNQNDNTTRTITSHYKPKANQDHRSSENFSTKGMKGGAYIQWTVPDGVSFDVMYDRTAMSDPTVAHSLSNGSRTKFEGYLADNDHLYIANPKGASQDFTVTYSVFDDDGNSIYVSCNAPHLNGQDHRASDNFSIGSGVFRVECPDGVKFKIKDDRDVISDGTVYEELTNGSIINVAWQIDFIYIADITGADNALLIKFIRNTTEWMTYLSDDTEFYSMSIPATHDSGSFLYNGISTCQNFKFREQLDHGIRCFDVRLDGNLVTCHGGISMETTFDEIMNTFCTWLNAHPRESIIMMIKAESDESKLRNNIKNYFNDSNNSAKVAKVYRGQSFPKLGDARGKIILMRRFATPDNESDDKWGINIGAGWPDDATGQYTCQYFKSYIEDRFYSADEAIHDTDDKTTQVYNAITDANSGNYNDYVFLIYNSVAGRLDHTPWDYAWGGGPILVVDPIMNESLSNTLNEFAGDNGTNKFRTGMLFLDYYNKHGDDDPLHLVQRIINSNFGEKKIPY